MNPRNSAAGAIRQAQSERESADRPLSFGLTRSAFKKG